MTWDLGLNFFSEKSILFELSQLESTEFRKTILEGKFHTYIIGKRKKIFLQSCITIEENSEIVVYYLDDKHEKVFLKYSFNNPVAIDPRPNGKYEIIVNGSEVDCIFDYELINILDHMNSDFSSNKEDIILPSDLEVLYIGQAFGRNKTRAIDSRLSHHEKVQKIALDIVKKGSNEEVLIIGLVANSHDLKTSLVRQSSQTKAPTVEDLEKVLAKSQVRTTESQQITIFEASLIKYFKPTLNTEYKETFPSKGFTSYDELFTIEFDYSALEINMEEMWIRLYSQAVPARKFIHIERFPLRSKSEKETLFEYIFVLSDA